MSDKGVFSKEQEGVLIDLADEAIKGNFITEPLSDIALKMLIPLIDDKLLDKLVVKLKLSEVDIQNLRDVFDSILSKDYDTAGERLSDIIDAKVDIPGIDDSSEAWLFDSLFGVIVALVKSKLEKEGSQPKPPGQNDDDDEDEG